MLFRIELEAFLILSEEFHFGRTAERLHVSTGRVSQAIQALERRVGAPLFVRTSRVVRHTAIGKRLYDEMRPASEQITAAFDRAVASGRGIEGVLRVGYSSPFCGDLVASAADLFRSRHPDCEVLMCEVQFHDPVGPLRTGEIDLQLSEFPLREPDLVTGPVIFREPRALMVPAGHPLADRESVSVEDLAGLTVVTVERGLVPDYWLDAHYPRHTPSGRPITHGPSVLFWQEMMLHVAAGRGVSAAPLRVAGYYSHPGITFVPFRDAPLVEYGLVWPSAGENGRVRAFVETVRELRLSQAAPSAAR